MIVLMLEVEIGNLIYTSVLHILINARGACWLGVSGRASWPPKWEGLACTRPWSDQGEEKILHVEN